MSARLLKTSDADAWNAALPAERSAFGSLGFARAQERAGQGEQRLLVAEADGARVAYPLQLRPLTGLPFTAELEAGRWDSASPPFTGPLTAGEVSGAQREALAGEIAETLAAEGVVAEFAHLHPWSAEPALVGGGEPDREIVWVDLTLDPQRLWRESYSKACRKNVNRAEREGVSVRAATDADDIAEFHRIYIATMERNEALDAYFFERDYFQAILAELSGSARFALAEQDGRVIAATLYLHDGDDVYSYLGGADHDHQQLRPTNAVVHETIRWAREQGKRRLILGGGYRPGDGIFRFKASFSPQRATLALARRVHLRQDYDALVDAWRAHHGDSADEPAFFPAYRGVGPT
jgi:CelD/BcsL family acetyltransferase involved in cellulose biosynthesis